jgi:hypothetical protein
MILSFAWEAGSPEIRRSVIEVGVPSMLWVSEMISWSGRMRSQPEFGVSFVNPAAEGIAFVKVFERQIDDSGRAGQSLKSVQIKFLPCPSDRTNADDVEHRQREEDHRCGFQITLCAGFQSERI